MVEGLSPTPGSTDRASSEVERQGWGRGRGSSSLLQDQTFWAWKWDCTRTPSYQLGAPKDPWTKSEATSANGLSIVVLRAQLTIPKD